MLSSKFWLYAVTATFKLEIKWELELLAPRKYPYPPYGWSLETLKGWGVLKGKIFKAK